MATIGETSRPGFVYDSATDTWIPVGIGPHAHTPAAIGAISNALVDAKGDLITATANDLPARLGVGTDGFFLQAASAESTGLKWAGTYTSWTPTLTNITLGNGTINAKYLQIGKLVHATIAFTWGSTTSSSGTWYFSFPLTCATSGSTYIGTCRLLDAGTANYPGMILVENSTSFLPFAQYAANTWTETSNVSTTTPFTWTTNDNMSASFIYETV